MIARLLRWLRPDKPRAESIDTAATRVFACSCTDPVNQCDGTCGL